MIRWLPRSKALGWLAACVVAIGLLTLFINPFFAFLTRIAVSLMQALGLQVSMPVLQPDAFPFWDSCMTVLLSVVAMILMTRKYVENWLLWVIVNVISVVIFARQGVYAMSLEYLLLTFTCARTGSRMWINSARERGSSRVFWLMVVVMIVPGVHRVEMALRAAARLVLHLHRGMFNFHIYVPGNAGYG